MSALSSSSMARDNPIKKLATVWLKLKKPLMPIWRFLTSHMQEPPRDRSSRFSTLKEYVFSPWTWGAIGTLAGAVLQIVPLAWTFLFAWFVLSFAVILVRPFWGAARFVRVLSIAFISLVIGVVLWGGWRIVPKAQPAAKPATAAEIAAEVSKILPKSNGGAATTTMTKTAHSAQPEVSLIFKDSPSLTPERKRRITDAINSFYLYLKSLGFPVENEMPPIGVSPCKTQMMSGIFPGTIYQRQIYLPKDSLDDTNAIRKVYASYVFRLLFGTFGSANLGPDAGKDETTAALFEVYYTSSLANRNLDRSDWQGHKWMEALWDIRQKKGRDFADRAMYYTYKTWDPKPVPGDFESKFWTRFLSGVWVIDNNGASVEAVGSILAQHHISQTQ